MSALLRPAPQKVAVLGAGSWGTTFAKVVGDAAEGTDRQVVLWGRRPEVVAQINTEHRNEQYLPGIMLPANVSATADVAAALRGAE
ncbi:MAG: glycerol-3-phosphate dehydrogenase, partial [Actinomycetota bacterium]|nr:glycerol-3-phosphate dehydrogenase [Actinomycetota bacterium]